jgi:hypothetical protein
MEKDKRFDFTFGRFGFGYEECNGTDSCCSEKSEENEDNNEEFEIEKAVMTSRLWIEYGKMLNNLIVDGADVSITNCLDDDENDVYSHSYSGEEFASPYLAMKDLYFRQYLEVDDYTDFPLNLDGETLDKLYLISDKEGITLDELVIRILKEMV